MATNLYEAFTNPIAKETFRCISYDENAYTMQWTVQADGYVPFEHIHLNQDEIFHIKQGQIRIMIDGKEHIANPGESIRVPKGVRHIAYNNKPEVLDTVVEYKPGLDHYKFFQCFGGLTIDRDIDKKGAVNIPKMLYFMKRMKCRALARPTSIPGPMLYIMMNVFYVVGSIAGWEKQYKKYTGG